MKKLGRRSSDPRRNAHGHNFLVVALAGAGAAAALSPIAAHAQTPPAATTKKQATVEDVVVTAQRRSERLQTVPVAVTALTSKALQERGVTNLLQIGQFTPSLVVQPTNRPGGGGSAIAAFIRGVGTGDYNIPTDPAIGIYVDGVYLARSIGGLMSLPDISQIEVLRGPQGTLYGRNTLGGAISITTVQPKITGPIHGSVEAHGGTDGRADFIANVNGPLIQDVLGGKLSFATYNSNGFGKDELTGADQQ